MEEILLTKKEKITESSKKAGIRLLGAVWKHKWLVVTGIICAIVSTLMFGTVPLFVKYIIDSIVEGNLDRVTIIVFLIVIVFAVRWVIAFLNMYFITLGGMRLVEDLRNQAYARLLQMSFGYFQKRQSGEIMSRLAMDTGVVQMFVTSGISEIVRIPIGIVVSLAIVIVLSAKLTLLALLLMPAIVIIIRIGGERMKKVSLLLQQRIATFNALMFELFNLVNVVKMFSMERHEEKRFSMENRLVVDDTMKQVKVRSSYSPMVEFLGACCMALIFWIGARAVVNQVPDFITGRILTIGDVSALFLGLQQLFTQVNRINHVNLTMQHAFAAAERTYHIIDMEPDIQDKPDAIEIPEIKGNIEISNVCFEYNEGERVLNGVSLKIEPGMVVALVGSSGSGKSTLVNLIPRFYDVTSGSIKIEGIDIRDAKISSFRDQIGIVPQDTLLFRNTVKANIAYGKAGATDEELFEAAEAAYANEFIKDMPQGYDTMVGERGATLSGGQRQRVAIARAILKDPRILILDEATSNVDNVSEKYIQAALEKLMRTRTTIVVAHRLSTIRNADLIAVLDRGQIVERGKHEELYELGGVYRKLYDLTLESERSQDLNGEKLT
ncbi:MAG TPA: ABC transporter ATP-binding protein [bacterium]|nr:ABC transporter ATP-binding protein [bacterium]